MTHGYKSAMTFLKDLQKIIMREVHGYGSRRRGESTRTMKADEMCTVLGSHLDFKNEKSSIERFLIEGKGHLLIHFR